MHTKGEKRYRTLFFSTLKLSACTFGGGFVIVPMMRKRFVEELGWINEQEMLDMTAIAQSAPGAIAVNASILVGYRVAGVWGAILSILGTILPPFGIITVISCFYKLFRDSQLVGMIMAGMLCGVAAVILNVTWDMLKGILRQKKLLPVLIVLFSFLAVRWWKLNILVIVLICGTVGGVASWYEAKKRKEGCGK